VQQMLVWASDALVVVENKRLLVNLFDLEGGSEYPGDTLSSYKDIYLFLLIKQVRLFCL